MNPMKTGIALLILAASCGAQTQPKPSLEARVATLENQVLVLDQYTFALEEKINHKADAVPASWPGYPNWWADPSDPSNYDVRTVSRGTTAAQTILLSNGHPEVEFPADSPVLMKIYDDNGAIELTVYRDGSVSSADPKKLDDAARMFWKAFAQATASVSGVK